MNNLLQELNSMNIYRYEFNDCEDLDGNNVCDDMNSDSLDFNQSTLILLDSFEYQDQTYDTYNDTYTYFSDSNLTQQQGYFYYLHGIIRSQSNLTVAEKNFKKAIKLGLSFNHDLAMAKLSLAGICMQKRRKREAMLLLGEAKKLDSQGMLNEQMKIMREQLKKI